MEKGYYEEEEAAAATSDIVAIHNKNGKGLLPALTQQRWPTSLQVAIHNKNGKGLLLKALQAKARKQKGRNPQ